MWWLLTTKFCEEHCSIEMHLVNWCSYISIFTVKMILRKLETSRKFTASNISR